MRRAQRGVWTRISIYSAAVLFGALTALFIDIVLTFALNGKDQANLDRGLWAIPVTWPPLAGRTISVAKPISQIAFLAWVVLLVILLMKRFTSARATTRDDKG